MGPLLASDTVLQEIVKVGSIRSFDTPFGADLDEIAAEGVEDCSQGVRQ